MFSHASLEMVRTFAFSCFVLFPVACLALASLGAWLFSFDASASALDVETTDATVAIATARECFASAARHEATANALQAYRARYSVPMLASDVYGSRHVTRSIDAHVTRAQAMAEALRRQGVSCLAVASGILPSHQRSNVRHASLAIATIGRAS